VSERITAESVVGWTASHRLDRVAKIDAGPHRLEWLMADPATVTNEFRRP
jgi:hypothetical protein